MNRLDQRRILVTGAASGTGQATALRLLDEGAVLVAADVSAEGLERTRALAEQAGTEARLSTMEMNIGDEASVVDGVRETVSRLGGLDQVIGINLTGTFLVVREALPALLSKPGSVVVNFSSTSAAFAHPYMAAYAASKGGIQSFTHALALEYGRQGLRAVSVAPGSTKSAITDATSGYVPADADWSLFAKLSPIMPTDLVSGGAGMGSPDQVAGVVAMLASEDGAFITGTEIRIDGGTHA